MLEFSFSFEILHAVCQNIVPTQVRSHSFNLNFKSYGLVEDHVRHEQVIALRQLLHWHLCGLSFNAVHLFALADAW